MRLYLQSGGGAESVESSSKKTKFVFEGINDPNDEEPQTEEDQLGRGVVSAAECL